MSNLVPSKWQQAWQDTKLSPYRRLLRLSILRDFSREVHTGRSIALADGQQGKLAALAALESRLEALKTSSEVTAECSLAELLRLPLQPMPRLPELPSALGPIERRLVRMDRHWELVIAVEAWERGWRFWRAEKQLPLTGVEQWHQTLVKDLWPRGILLFVEAGGASVPGEWNGLWTIVTAPEAGEVPQDAKWSLLFSQSTV